MNEAYEVHTALLEESIPISDNLKREIAIVNRAVIHLNNETEPSQEDWDRLNIAVEDFNYNQKYQAVRGSCEQPMELLKLYFTQRVVPQIKIEKHDSKSNIYGMEFHTAVLPFLEYYKNHKSAFPKYQKFFCVLSTLFHRIVDVLVDITDPTDPLYGFRQRLCYRIKDRKELLVEYSDNPINRFREYIIPPQINMEICKEKLMSRRKIRSALCSVANYYFPELNMTQFPKGPFDRIMWWIADHSMSESTIEYYLWLCWAIKKEDLSRNNILPYLHR